MSADTIPADVLSAAREALAAEFECSVKAFPASPARARRGEMDHTYELKAIIRAILTDRATRPAEPAAPVAEAGDGEVVAWRWRLKAEFNQPWGPGAWVYDPSPEWMARKDPEVEFEALVPLSTLEAERARADRLEQERDRQYEENVARIAAQGAAEQCAADALARAENAEGEIAEAERREKWELEQAKINRRHHDAKVHSYVIAELGIIRIKLAEARASREAQPATDGGDNG